MSVDSDARRAFSVQLRRINAVARELRARRPRLQADWRGPADWVVKYGNLDGRRATILSLTLTPTGCVWAKAGGCTMCGEYEGSTAGAALDPSFHIAQFAASAAALVRQYKPDWVRIYQEGSYLSASEMDSAAQSVIVGLASTLRGVRRITVESLARLVSTDAVEALTGVLTDEVELEIGMGLEAIDPVVRGILVNKGEDLAHFERAVEVLRTCGVKSLAYVLLKPPFLTEAEAVGEAAQTISAARELGFDAVTLEPMSLHRHSVVDALHSQGLYSLPWLWSLRESALTSNPPADLRIGGGTVFYPRPQAIPQNRTELGEVCACSLRLRSALRSYAVDHDLGVLRGVPDCSCTSRWLELMQEVDARPLSVRIDTALDRLKLPIYEEHLHADAGDPPPHGGAASLDETAGHDLRETAYMDQ